MQDKPFALMNTITFETKCYENDWEFILKGNYLKKMIERCGIKFSKRQLIINNVNDRNIVEKFAKMKVEEGVIDTFYFAEDFADETLNFFEISKESFNNYSDGGVGGGGTNGYVYSISELVGIYKCQTGYLLHFASDSFLSKNSSKTNWIEKAVLEMEVNSKFVIANPTWNFNYKEMKTECEQFGYINEFGISQGCSDQCYLIKISEFKKPIFNYKHHDSERYPKYGGELFEKRVDSYLRCTNHYRLNHTKAVYIHGNFPKQKIKRKILFFVSNKLNITFSLLFREPWYFVRAKKSLNSIKAKIKSIGKPK